MTLSSPLADANDAADAVASFLGKYGNRKSTAKRIPSRRLCWLRLADLGVAAGFDLIRFDLFPRNLEAGTWTLKIIVSQLCVAPTAKLNGVRPDPRFRDWASPRSPGNAAIKVRIKAYLRPTRARLASLVAWLHAYPRGLLTAPPDLTAAVLNAAARHHLSATFGRLRGKAAPEPKARETKS